MITQGEGPGRAPWQAALALFAVLGVLTVVIGFAADVAGLSDQALSIAKGHPLLGWSLAVTLLLLSATSVVWACRTTAEGRKDAAAAVSAAQVHSEKRVDEIRADWHRAIRVAVEGASEHQSLLRRQGASDLSLVETLLGGLCERGSARTALENLPTDKRFSANLARDLEDALTRCSLNKKPIYTSDIQSSFQHAMDALERYGVELLQHLDAPSKYVDLAWDLTVIEPPGGPWGDDWETFYSFVRSLTPLRLAALDALRELDGELHNLRVQVGATESTRG